MLIPDEVKEKREWKEIRESIDKAVKKCEGNPHTRCTIKCRTEELAERAREALSKLIDTKSTTYVEQIKFDVSNKDNSGKLLCITHHRGPTCKGD